MTVTILARMQGISLVLILEHFLQVLNSHLIAQDSGLYKNWRLLVKLALL